MEYAARMDDEALRGHYASGYERRRLSEGSSRIEFARTKELLERFLPEAPATVLDVGGGPGDYAAWLAGRGYGVHLVDALALHVDQATNLARENQHPFTTAVGDARDLDQDDASFDAVLMLGPLYHLTDRVDRVRALAEGHRVVRPAGVVLAAGISRFAALLDGLVNGWLGDPAFDAVVDGELRDGQHRNPTGHPEWFTTAFFHHPDELRAECEEAALTVEGIYGIEGPGWLLWQDLWDDASGQENILRVARALEHEPSVVGTSSHLLAVTHRL